MKKLKKFTICLGATLPCSATMEVEAATQEEAKEWAFENWHKFPWDGPDYNTPDGCDVDTADVL